jgi:ABC-type antimicrobial peptide transport system permease subunit
MNLKIGYIIKIAFRNILSHKRHMFIIMFGFIISISLLLSVSTWSRTAESLAITDFLAKQDYQAYIFSEQKPEDIQSVINDLDDIPIVETYTTAYATYALFNTEDKSDSYVCLPEFEQNQSNPVSITNSLIVDQATLDRVSFLFTVEGEFSIENNGMILSLQQKNELSEIYGYEIQLGDLLNVSIARNIPDLAFPGQDQLGAFDTQYFQDLTVRGIYTIREGVSILQSIPFLNLEWLADSLIFPKSMLDPTDISEMEINDIPYLLLVKFKIDEITKDGLDEIILKMELFREQIKKDYPTMFIYTLDAPIESLIASYSRASFTIVYLLPVILIGVVMTILTTNVVVQSREGEVGLLRDRGADTFQIILLFIIEFAIVSFFGIIIGIILSFPLAAILPAFTSTGFSGEVFSNFIRQANFSYSFSIPVIFGLLGILLGYASFKIWWDISNRYKNTEHERSARKKLERNIIIGVTIGLGIVIAIALVFRLVDIIRLVQGTRNFTVSNTEDAGYLFILFLMLLVILVQAINYLISDVLQVKMKGFLKRLVFIDAFFLFNNFKRKDKKLNKMSFSVVLVSSIVIFTLISASSITINQQLENEYKNGADLRIVTYPLDNSFTNNISEINGINEVVPIMKATTTIAFDTYTIYGIDPVIYSRVGKWDRSSFPVGSSLNNVKNLEDNDNGIIISEALAERLNVTIGEELTLNNLPGGIYYRTLEILGIIISAPGLGLADGANVEMFQPYRGFILMNNDYMTREFQLSSSQLFLASVMPGEDINQIKNDIENIDSSIIVNPPSINEQFIGSFIDLYIPNVQTFLWISLVTTALIIVILLIMVTEFTLSQRSKEFAISLTLGSSRQRLSRLLFIEVIIIVFTASIGGLLLGLIFTYSTFYLMTPLLTSHNILPFTINIPVIQLLIYPIALTLIALIGVLPSIIKHRKQKIITALRS